MLRTDKAITLNKYGQGLIASEILADKFSDFGLIEKRNYLKEIIALILTTFKNTIFCIRNISNNICEAKVFVFGEVVSQIGFIKNAIENKNEIVTNLGNDVAITYKSESGLL